MMKFTIRLKPQDGESLSSYLFRCCQVNRISFESLWRLICLSKASKVKRKVMHSWDVNPYVQLDFKKIAYLTGQTEEVLESLTYFSVLRKLISGEVNKTTLRLKSFEGHEYIHHKSRKICADCVAQGEGHKLIWNVKGVDYCEKHQCLLIDSCHSCKEHFEYSDASFLEGSCPHCQKLITNEQIKDKNTFLLQKNSPYYLSWKWLLTNEKWDKQIQFSTGSVLGFKLMFALQNTTNEKLYRKEWYRGLKRAANVGSEVVTLASVFKVVELTKKSLWELDKIKLSDEMIEEIKYFPQRKPISLGECLAPWCSSYLTNQKILRVGNPYWFSNRKSYKECSVCTSCYMEYGYSKETGEWENTGAIKFIQEVQTLKKGLVNNNEIIKRLRTSLTKVYEALCYSDYYIGTNFYPESQITPRDAVKCFNELFREKGALWKKAKELYGWDFKEYYSIFSMKEVKQFLYFNSHHCRKRGGSKKSKVKSIIKKEVFEHYSNIDTEMDMNEVAATLDITRGHLYHIGLNEIISSNNKRVRIERCEKEGERLTLLAEEFIRMRLENQQHWLKSEIYEYLGIRNMALKHKHLKLFEYIDRQYVASKQIISENELNELKKRAEQAVKDLRDQGNIVLTKKIVCESIGFTYGKVSDSWPNLLSYIGLLVNM